MPTSRAPRDVRDRVVPDHGHVVRLEALDAEVRRKAGQRLFEDDRRWLATDHGRPAGRDLEARDKRTRVDRLATRRQPPRVAVHRHELRAAPDRPERDVHVAVAELVAAIADDDGGQLTRRGGVGLVRRHERLPVELAQRVGGGDHEEAAARRDGSRCMRRPRRRP